MLSPRPQAVILVTVLTLHVSAAPATEELNSFAAEFWSWRSVHMPITSDDLPRTAVVRPKGCTTSPRNVPDP